MNIVFCLTVLWCPYAHCFVGLNGSGKTRFLVKLQQPVEAQQRRGELPATCRLASLSLDAYREFVAENGHRVVADAFWEASGPHRSRTDRATWTFPRLGAARAPLVDGGNEEDAAGSGAAVDAESHRAESGPAVRRAGREREEAAAVDVEAVDEGLPEVAGGDDGGQARDVSVQDAGAAGREQVKAGVPGDFLAHGVAEAGGGG
ncbi:hypothetical protein PF011_g5123 [Phytophthora fragariae]|uniref:Kinesin motor domain-containing protein n=1 Tax=Phytophthora fragariae TaxID=53985 RepID=A0A6A3LNY9_9STRA|nr:hypothetical protein PF011_g5123 [Phytophthora fragariae]KAE9351278.1 hypothetical protein PF008_g6033 [Phytophthora fragariae]